MKFWICFWIKYLKPKNEKNYPNYILTKKKKKNEERKKERELTTKNGSYIRFIQELLSVSNFSFYSFTSQFQISLFLIHFHIQKNPQCLRISCKQSYIYIYIYIFYIYIYAPSFLSLSAEQAFMAGLHSTLRPTSSYSSLSLSSSSSAQSFTSRLVLLLTLLSFTLAGFAFILQWRGGLNDPVTRWSPDHHEFPGMAISGSGPSHPSRSDCIDLLGQSRSPTFPYYRDWNFGLVSDLKPKVRYWFMGFGSWGLFFGGCVLVFGSVMVWEINMWFLLEWELILDMIISI